MCKLIKKLKQADVWCKSAVEAIGLFNANYIDLNQRTMLN